MKAVGWALSLLAAMLLLAVPFRCGLEQAHPVADLQTAGFVLTGLPHCETAKDAKQNSTAGLERHRTRVYINLGHWLRVVILQQNLLGVLNRLFQWAKRCKERLAGCCTVSFKLERKGQGGNLTTTVTLDLNRSAFRAAK